MHTLKNLAGRRQQKPGIQYVATHQRYNPGLDFTTVHAAAASRWPNILRHLAPALAAALDRPGRHVPCPIHGGKDGFRVFKDVNHKGGGLCNTCGAFADGFALLAWINGWRLSETLWEVARFLGIKGTLGSSQFRHHPIPSSKSASKSTMEADTERTRRKLAKIWRAALPLDHPGANSARHYLKARGLSELLDRGDLPADVHLHLALDYWHGCGDSKPAKLATLPALVALVRNPAGTVVGLHRTYLKADGDGKARIPDPDHSGEFLPAKKLLALAPGATKGGAIQLYATGPRLVVAEGLETALAVRIALPNLPCWATISAGGMAALVLPESMAIREVFVGADHDASGTGQRAAYALAQRLMQRSIRVRVVIPKLPGTDWADLLTGERNDA